MRIRSILMLLLLLSATIIVRAQENGRNGPAVANKQFYVELGGPGIIFSANYDQRFSRDRSTGLGFRIGLGYANYSKYDSNSFYFDKTESLATIPLGLNYVLGKSTSSHAFEIGAGATLLSRKVGVYYYDDNFSEGNVIGYATFMYRRVPIDGGFTWRIGLMPVIGTSGDLVLSGAVGFGYSF